MRAKVEGSKSVGFSKLKNLTDADVEVLSMGGLETQIQYCSDCWNIRYEMDYDFNGYSTVPVM